MKNRILITLITLIVGMALLFTACSQPAPAPAPAPAPTPAPAPKPIELVYATGYLKDHVQVGVVAEEWISRIDKATDGRVKIRGVYGGSLLSPNDTLEGVSKQVADAGSFVIGFTPGKLPISAALSAMIDLKLGNQLDMRGIAALNLKLVEEFPEFAAEFNNQNVTPVLWVPTVPYGIISVKPIKTFADLSGKKIRAFGVNLPKLVEASGAVPVAVAFGELYTGLQTGVVDAAITDPPAMHTAGKLYEVARYILLTGPGAGASTALAPVVYAFNNNSFAQLSAADQDIVKKVSKDMHVWAADLMTKTGEEAIEAMRKEGAEITHLPQAELDKWIAVSPDWYALVSKDLDGQGLPGTKIATRYQQLAKDYVSGAWNPWK